MLYKLDKLEWWLCKIKRALDRGPKYSNKDNWSSLVAMGQMPIVYIIDFCKMTIQQGKYCELFMTKNSRILG